MAEDNGDIKDFKFLPPCGNLYVLLGILLRKDQFPVPVI